VLVEAEQDASADISGGVRVPRGNDRRRLYSAVRPHQIQRQVMMMMMID